MAAESGRKGEVTHDYRGFQGVINGGDRAGLGEMRFYGESIPEPASAALLRRRR